MPRTARLNLPGGVFHLISRFTRDEALLDRAGARDAYLRLLARATETTDTEALAYCLMSTHVHLVVRQGDSPLERFTKSVHTGFASWVRRSAGAQRAQGPVFAGRPYGVVVEEEPYLLQLVRYVHNNPVRAGLVRRARLSDWSSHRAYVGMVQPPAWLRLDTVLAGFARDDARAEVRFDDFVGEGAAEGRRPEFSGATDAGEAARVRRELGDGHRRSDGVLGGSVFVQRVRASAERSQAALSGRGTGHRVGPSARPPVRQVIDAVLQLLEVDPIELAERPRSRRSASAKRLATFVWVHEYGGRQIELARALQLDTGVVSRYYGQAMALAPEYDELAGAALALLPRPAAVGAASAPATSLPGDATRVRYHVDFEEK